MGAHYWSVSVAGDGRGGDVEEALTRWLARKGYVEVPPVELRLEIDDEIERGFYLASSERWSVVLYSELAEMERLQLELSGLGRPTLGLWLHDSDIWGYELAEDGAVVSAFHSNPRYFGREEEPRGPNDLAALARVTGVDEATLGRLQRQRAVFKEAPCGAFARAISASPAASQYGYRFVGETDGDDAGFRVSHRRFRREDRGRLDGFELHLVRAGSAAPPDGTPRGADWRAMSEAVGPGPALALRSLGLFLRVVFFVLRPVFLLAGWLARPLLARRLEAAAGKEGAGAGAGPPRQTQSEGFLVDPTGLFRVRLLDGAVPDDEARGVRGLAFRVEGLAVRGLRLNARAARQTLGHGLGTLLYEDDFRVGELPAKAVGWRREGGPSGPAESHCVYVQTPWLVYQLAGYGVARAEPAAVAALRRVAETFEVVAPAPAAGS